VSAPGMLAVTAAPTRRARVLAHLAQYPGLTATELGRALGLSGQIDSLLRRMEDSAEITATRRWAPYMGRRVRHWRVAPPGTVPPPRPADPEGDQRRRERDRLAQRARRARRRGVRVPPGMEAPSLRDVQAAAPDFADAACRAADPDLFFAPDGERPAGRKAREAQAKAICAGCPARPGCLEYALDTGQGHGIWGGLGEDERRAMLRRPAARAS
jgi:WhiB family redox-sensing transcriptional regulator